MNLLGKHVYRFGDIEIDSVRGCVTRGGEEQYLRQQAFHVLLHLIEQGGRLVSKDELIESIWRDTAVTDNALVQCIVDIRKALGDDSHHPRFIKTIPKGGYRFITPVEEVRFGEQTALAMTDRAMTDQALTPLVSSITSGNGSSGVPRLPASAVMLERAEDANPWLSPRLSLTVAISIAVISALIFWFRPGTTDPHADVTLAHLPGRKPLAVMYFENQSARADVNWLREGLADMLITDLARSDKLTVLGRQQLYLLLERTGRNPAKGIQLDEALDLARKSHAEVVVLGSFAALGDEIRIDAQLYDTGNGQLVAADQLVVAKQSEILTQVDLLALKLARHLGIGPLDAGRKTTLAEMMTDNIEAYRYYLLGIEKARAFENAQAISLLEKAIRLDPKFAMAYAQIGYTYAVSDFLPEKGKPYLQKAFQLSDRLTEKDRLSTSAWYAISQSDYPAAIQSFRRIIVQYPLETEAYRTLGRLLLGEEKAEESIQVHKKGLSIDPQAKDLYNGIGIAYLSLARYEEAIAAHQRYAALAPKEPNAHDSLGMSLQQSGRYDEAVAEYNGALALDPEFEPAIIHLGDVYFQQGRYRESIRQYERYIHVTRSNRARAQAAGNIAHVYLVEGNYRHAESAAKSEILYEKDSVWNSLVIALDRGDERTAERLKQRLFQNHPYSERGARSNLRIEHYFRGYLALKSGKSAEAIARFQEALRHLPPTSGIELYEDCLANAYLELHRFDDAIREYERILRLNPNYALMNYRLAKAYEGKGETVEARAALERFLQLWKGADADASEVVDAKRLLARPAA